MQNIYWQVFYNSSALNLDVNAFYTGFGMSDYAFGDECLQFGTSKLSQLYAYNLNMTQRFSLADPFFAITYTIGSPTNDAWFYCY